MGHVSQAKIEFKKLLMRQLNADSGGITLFWKGRVGLLAILKSMNIQPGDEVIMPAYTCVVVPNPVIYLGGVPIYVDVDSRTFNIDIEKIEGKITPKTRFILAQNTYGLSSDLDAIKEIAQKYKLRVIEDCAHGFGGLYKGKSNGANAEASFFSTQWNKPFSTGLGGMVFTPSEQIQQKLVQLEQEFRQPSWRDVWLLRILYYIREHLLTPSLYWRAVGAYRWLSNRNLILGSSQGEELEDAIMPDGFEKGMSDFQAKIGLAQLNKFPQLQTHRLSVAGKYDQMVSKLGIETPYQPEYAKHGYLKYPLFVRDRQEFFKLAEKAKIELGDWFLSPIHPVQSGFEKWNYHWGENPIGEKLSQHVINLPTHLEVDENYIDRIYAFLKVNRKSIFDSARACLNSPGIDS